MQTKRVFLFGDLSIILGRHVSARLDSQEGRQGPPLFQRDGYFSVMENKRVGGRGRVVQRHVLYLGEINDSQERAWRKSIEVFEEGSEHPKTLSLFPEDSCEGLLPDGSVVGVKLSELRLERRANGARAGWRSACGRSCSSGGQGMVATVLDYTKFLQMIENGGELDGHRLLSPVTVAFMTSDQPGQICTGPTTYTRRVA